MRIPRLVWDRKHNVASVTVSYGPRIWHTREIGDMILGYNAAGRLARVVLLDPGRMLPDDASVEDALGRVLHVLVRSGSLRQQDHDVLRSAMDRAGAHARQGTKGNGPGSGNPSPESPNRTASPEASPLR